MLFIPTYSETDFDLTYELFEEMYFWIQMEEFYTHHGNGD